MKVSFQNVYFRALVVAEQEERPEERDLGGKSFAHSKRPWGSSQNCTQKLQHHRNARGASCA
jgi:hypothetical protein